MVFKITVDKNFPVPENAGNKGRPAVYPWKEMEVGDSFFVPLDMMNKVKKNKSINQLRGQLANTAYRYGQRHQSRFATRKEGTDRNKKQGVRIWRIE